MPVFDGVTIKLTLDLGTWRRYLYSDVFIREKEGENERREEGQLARDNFRRILRE